MTLVSIVELTKETECSKKFTKKNKAAIFALVLMSTGMLRASDHDDGEIDDKGRSLNLTDLFAFREDWQSPNAANASQKMVVIMNTNPRSLPGQQYFFSTNARYEFHFTRVPLANKAITPTGVDDVTIRITFDAPDSQNGNRQPIHVVGIKGGIATAATGTATSYNNGESVNGVFGAQSLNLGGAAFDIAAGMRQDPFFFDVIGFFKTRFALANSGGTVTQGMDRFASNSNSYNAKAQDFTAYYNVNSIVARFPISYLQTSAAEPIFDIWETISIAN